MIKNLVKCTVIILAITSLTACSTIFDRLSQINKEPEFSSIQVYESRIPDDGLYTNSANITIDPRYQDESMYRKNDKENDSDDNNIGKNLNSIWHDRSNGFSQGCKSFFKARSVGDVISIAIILDNIAALNSQTSTNQSNDTNLGFGAKFGPANNYDLDVGGKGTSSGGGNINRKESVRTTIGVTVIRVMNNSGNLIVRGSQEMKINNELRVITIEGIIRPEDIDEKNVVFIERVAEARISYGGRGQIAQYQYPPYGKQIVDAITPF